MTIGASQPSMQRMISYTCRITSMHFCYSIHAICPILSYMRFVAVRTLPWVAFAAHIITPVTGMTIEDICDAYDRENRHVSEIKEQYS